MIKEVGLQRQLGGLTGSRLCAKWRFERTNIKESENELDQQSGENEDVIIAELVLFRSDCIYSQAMNSQLIQNKLS